MSALIKSLAVLAMGIGTVILCLSVPTAAEGDNAGVVMRLPDRVLHLWGTPEGMSKEERRILPEDTEYAKMNYQGIAPDGVSDYVSATIVLSGSDRRSLHRPEVCLNGQGWSIDTKEVAPVELKNGETLNVMKLGLSREEEVARDKRVKINAVYLYWYVGRDVTTPRTEWRMMMSVRDNVFRNINHRWAYISVLALVGDEKRDFERGEEETLKVLGDFIRESVTEFQKTF